MLDTGAQISTLKIPALEEKLHLTVNSPGMKPVGSLDNTHGAGVWSYRFKTLTFGDADTGSITVGNPEAQIIPDMNAEMNTGGVPMAGRPTFGGKTALPDMLVGMNILRHLHIYNAYREQKLYVTPASAPGGK